MFFEALLVILFLILCFYSTWTAKYNYWKDNGVVYTKGNFPFGNIGDIILMRKTIGDVYDELYWKFPGVPCFGFFKLWQPILMARDPELVKTILVKEFENFHDNDYYVNPIIDPILGLNPFNTKGKRWKAARSIVTPSLTPSKIKAMIPQIIKVSEEMIIFLRQNKEPALEAYDLIGKYTTDVVSTCAYGIQCNSFKNENDEVRKMSRKMFDGSFSSNLALLSAFFFPKLNDVLKLQIMSQEVTDYFVSLVASISEHRNKTGEVRHDYIQSLIDANNEAMADSDEKKPLYSNLELAAHCMTFFLDGYETTAILASFILFELGVNQDVQEKLRNEINGAHKNLDEYTFDSIHNLHYLEMVVQEGLRKHPPGTTTTRVCTKECRIQVGKQKIRIEKGIPVVLPMYSIHNDPNNFPNPGRFDPDRFLEVNKSKRHPYAHFPFGAGPRSCPGFKFALSMVKLAIIGILLEFQITLAENQSETIENDPMNTFFHSSKNGLWLSFKKLT